MVRRKKSHIRSAICIMIIAFLTIGYAYLTSSLSINGTTLLKNPTWDVHFENIQVKDGSVTGEQVIDEPEIDSLHTTVSFHIRLKEPGEFYEFTVDAVNAGTIDAMVNTFTNLELTSAQQAYLDASVTYEDGEEVLEHQQLLAGDSAVFKVSVAYKQDLDPEDLPSSPEQLDLDFSIEFEQKNDSAIERRAEKTFYNLLKKEEKDGGLVRKYTGAHQDSIDASLSTKDIYHWYANYYSDVNLIKDKWNVIFADHCWQMLRTTDTGGVKLIYNGEVVDGKCLTTRGNHIGYRGDGYTYFSTSYYYGSDYIYDKSTNTFRLSGDITTGSIGSRKYTCRSTSSSGTCSTLYFLQTHYDGSYYYVFSLDGSSHYSQFGKMSFTSYSNSLDVVGYMNSGNNYKFIRKGVSVETMYQGGISLSTSYWYAHDAVWGSPVSNTYNLINPYQVDSSSSYSELVGEYTFRNTSQSYTYYNVNYIAAVEGSYMYYFDISSGKTLSDINFTYTYGNSYTANGDGSYTINSPNTVSRVNWYNEYSNVGSGKYVCKNATNNTCSELWYTISTDKTQMKYIIVGNVYKFAADFSYNSSTGLYELSNNSVSFWNTFDSNNTNSVSNHHYTCWNETGVCSEISYVFDVFQNEYRYIRLDNGKSISDALDDMLYGNNVNIYDSYIKSALDLWSRHYLNDYLGYLEDSVFCNDRSQSNASENGWNPNGGSLSVSLRFANSSSGLSCVNVNDSFSMNNPKAQLTYPVGLLTYPEKGLFGYYTLLQTGQTYWLMSPSNVGEMSMIHNIHATNNNSIASSNNNYGVRPVISLKPGIVFSSGDGSMANPYVVDTN